jgi:riboflavin biosynthesis pyrimidine reductase
LRFPIPDILTAGGRKVVVFTSANPNPERVAEIEAKAGRVIVAGEQRVEGAALLERMTELGYQTVYNSTGPKVLHLLLAGGVLNRLYLSYANRLLGGSPYATVVEGPSLEPAVDMRLNEVYFDPHAPDELGQLLVSYDCV